MQAVRKIYSVSELTLEIKRLVEGGFPAITVEGEISNFRPSSSGHLYFTLKDSGATLSAVMFKNRLSTLSFKPMDGKKVIARGSLSLYPQRGNYQIICETLEAAGEGDILAMLEARKRKLAAEGLFDSARKKPLPVFPGKVAVISSPTGAAVRDILKVLRRVGLDVVILPAPVQGEGAAALIAAQIRRANRYAMADVIIMGRGGGSLEDLLPFSDEELVREVAASKIPLISAVGHEIDTSLSDYAADFRAATPTAAAQAVCAARDDFALRVRQARDGMEEALRYRREKIRLLLERFTPESMEQQFHALLQPILFRLDDSKEALLAGIWARAKENRRRLELSGAVLASCSPREILRRGYAVVRRGTQILRSAAGLASGEELLIQLHEGEIDATVKEARN